MGKSCRKYAPKATPRSFLFLANNPKQPFHTRKSFKDILKANYQKLLKVQLYFFFRTQSLLMDKIIKKKRGLKLVTSRPSSYKRSSQKFSYQLCFI